MYPDNSALYVDEQYFSYKELLQETFKIFTYLNQRYPNEERIGVVNANNLATYAALLAVSLSNKTYVPIEKKNPKERNLYIRQVAGLHLVLCGCDEEKPDDIEVVDLSKVLQIEKTSFDQIMTTLPLKKGVENNLAYIIFTSGTTGKPKGVPVSNANVNHFLEHFIDLQNYDFSPEDRFLQMFDLGFDLSVFSIFVPLSIGACVYVLPQEGIKYLEIAGILMEQAITVALMAPSALYYLKPYLEDLRLPELRYSFFCGEVLKEEICKQWSSCLSDAHIVNLYGPAEVTVACTEFEWINTDKVKQSINGIVSIGKVFEGLTYLIIGEDNLPLIPGDIGELCLSGPQVVAAYLGDIHKEAFFEYEGKWFYKTGDMVAQDDKENLYFYGRKDNQVKINGYRVELAEIEKCINNYFGDEVAVVIKRTNTEGVDELFAFVVELKEVSELKDFIQQHLPDYMMPKQFVSIGSFPLNSNGKIDMLRLKSLLSEDKNM